MKSSRLRTPFTPTTWARSNHLCRWFLAVFEVHRRNSGMRTSEVKRITRQSGHSSQNQATRREQPRPVRRIRRRGEVKKQQNATTSAESASDISSWQFGRETKRRHQEQYARILYGIRIIFRGDWYVGVCGTVASAASFAISCGSRSTGDRGNARDQLVPLRSRLTSFNQETHLRTATMSIITQTRELLLSLAQDIVGIE